MDTDKYGWEKGFQQRKRIYQSVRPPEFAEGTFCFNPCPSVVSLNRCKLKLELQRFGQQIAEQWQMTVRRRSSDYSLRFRFRSRSGMKSSASSGNCSRLCLAMWPAGPGRINFISRSG